MAKKTAKEGVIDMHSFHIQLPTEELRRLRIMAAERGTSAGRLARELLVKAMEEESRKSQGGKK